MSTKAACFESCSDAVLHNTELMLIAHCSAQLGVLPHSENMSVCQAKHFRNTHTHRHAHKHESPKGHPESSFETHQVSHQVQDLLPQHKHSGQTSHAKSEELRRAPSFLGTDPVTRKRDAGKFHWGHAPFCVAMGTAAGNRWCDFPLSQEIV